MSELDEDGGQKLEVNVESILVILEAAAAKEEIADAAIAWRQALLGGKFDKAGDKLTTMSMLIDKHLGL